MLNTRVMLSILLVIEKAVGIVAQLCLTLCTVIWSFLTLECLFGCDYDHCLCLSELFITVMVVVDLTVSTNRVSCLERCSLLCVEWDFKPAHSLSSLAINGITYAILQYKISIWVRPSVALSKKKCYVRHWPLSVAFQHMMMEDEAKRAIMELNGCMLNGNRLNVEVLENHICVITLSHLRTIYFVLCKCTHSL